MLNGIALGWSWEETKREIRTWALSSGTAEGDPHMGLKRRHGGKEVWTQVLEVAMGPSADRHSILSTFLLNE